MTLKDENHGRGDAPNFPKSKDNVIFLRGSGRTSKDKIMRLKKWGIDIKMYSQYVWIKGDYIVSNLSKMLYL